ncbi:MAG: D-alanyl-D-alanine carboxypeptidase [Oscillospiraceae bacterium]|nr:D-alanyl-D-alanine carboxypeptidase [Oscillospiraceae bacterium]
MKKWLFIEIVVLVAVLIAAVAVCMELPVFSGDQGDIDLQNTPTGAQTTAPTETTEPDPTWMSVPNDWELTAQQAFVYDVTAGEFVFLKGSENDRVYPASITKLMTAYVALQFLEPETQITAGDVLELVGAGSSVAEIEKGDTLTVERLVEAMLLPSGNDAAYILADAAGRVISGYDSISAWDAVAAFLKEMNGQARSLGMTGTNFTNPDGYHSADHYTTFADLAVLGKKVLENKTIMKYAAVSEETVTLGGEEKKWENTNELVRPTSKYYCPIATGLKTGQTPSAGSCLLSSFEYEGGKWIIGVFGCPEKDDRFDDTLWLLNKTLFVNTPIGG